MKRWIMAVQIAISLICVVWLYISIDWTEAFHECAMVSLAALCVVFAQRFVPYMMLGLRLKYIFRSDVDFLAGFKASLLCVGCNNIFPARAGELAKIFWLNRNCGVEYSRLFSGVFLERLLDVSALLLLALAFALPLLNVWLAIFLATALCGTWTLVIWLGHNGNFPKKWLDKLLFAKRGCSWMNTFLEFLGDRSHGWIFLKIIFATVLVWSMNYLHICLLTDYLLDLRMTWEQIGLFCVAVYFSSGLLLIPGGVGGMEAIVVAALGLCGIGAAKAAAAAVFVRLFYSIPPLIGALWVLCLGKNGFAAGLKEMYDGTKIRYHHEITKKV